MSHASETTIQVLIQLVQVSAVGTNLGLLQLMWAMVNGSFLRSRGAVLMALHLSGFSPQEIRRSWQALRRGIWNIGEMIGVWRGNVLSAGEWQVSRYEGYRPLAADVTTFWRPRLQGWSGKFYQALANRALTGVGLGVVTEVGRIGQQRIPLLKQLVRPPQEANHDKGAQQAVLQWVKQHLEADEVLLYDGGTHLAEVQEMGIARYLIRLALNCTARRNQLPVREEKRGRPVEYGAYVRPLARQRKEKDIAATPADSQTSFRFQERMIVAAVWSNLVRSDQKVNPDNPLFTIWVFHDPDYGQPLVIGTNLSAQAETIYRLYRDRWPVEVIPLGAKQMLGLHRQFVFAVACCYRLPELALLVANVLAYLAAVLPPIPSAFWDRHPKKHRGVYVASWPNVIFPNFTNWMAEFEKKRLSLTTCPRASRHTSAKSALNDPFWVFVCPHC